jgi:flagellar biosynthesis/type III secretory pathway protein FliH
MPETLRISLAQPVLTLHVVEGPAGGAVPNRPAPLHRDDAEPARTQPLEQLNDLEPKKRELAQLCETVNGVVTKLEQLCQQTISDSHGDIARLAVEIARKIVACEIGKGNYDIAAIVKEALKRAPTRQDIVVRMNPKDAMLCLQLQQENPDSPLAGLKFEADPNISPANCLIETPKGTVRSFIDEGLERIREALEKSQ